MCMLRPLDFLPQIACTPACPLLMSEKIRTVHRQRVHALPRRKARGDRNNLKDWLREALGGLGERRGERVGGGHTQARRNRRRVVERDC